jgi:hypothetical protein
MAIRNSLMNFCAALTARSGKPILDTSALPTITPSAH